MQFLSSNFRKLGASLSNAGDVLESPIPDLAWIQVKSILRDFKDGISPEDLLQEFTNRFKVRSKISFFNDIFLFFGTKSLIAFNKLIIKYILNYDRTFK